MTSKTVPPDERCIRRREVASANDDPVDQADARALLQLTARDFELAVRIGEVGVMPAPPGSGGPPGRPVVPRAELDRLTAETGFPETLRDRLSLVGTASGARLIGVSRDRFARLARAGCFRPVGWYLNRYRALVWLYPEAEVRAFAADHPGWLSGRLPDRVRERLAGGCDLRAAGWRARRTGLAIGRAVDAWQEAAVWLALLGTGSAEDLFRDEAERARVAGSVLPVPLGPPFDADPGDPYGVSAIADDPQEIAFARLSLGAALERARAAVRPQQAPSDLPEAYPSEADVPVPRRRSWPLNSIRRDARPNRRPVRWRLRRGGTRSPR